MNKQLYILYLYDHGEKRAKHLYIYDRPTIEVIESSYWGAHLAIKVRCASKMYESFFVTLPYPRYEIYGIVPLSHDEQKEYKA